MAHGHSDYGGAAPLATVYTLQDLGELAARLGSIVTFDRRGNVIFLDDFEGSLSKYYTYTDGAGASVAISNEKARHGDFSCKLVSGDTAGDEAWIRGNLPYPVLSRMGIEVCWYATDHDKLEDFDLLLRVRDGSNEWYPGVAWVAAEKTWYYHNGGAWVALSPTQDFYSAYVLFNFTKLVVDFVNQEYVRLISNNLVYDLSGKSYSGLPTDAPAHLWFDFIERTRVDDNCVVYLDSIIITQNEP